MANTYTFSSKAAPAVGASNFGGIPVDGNHQTMTGLVGAGPQTVDISGTPVVSPVTVATSATTTLTIPLNAAQVNIVAATNTINISESDNTVAANFFTIPVGQVVTLEVARCSKLFMRSNTGNAAVSFWFNVL